MESLARFTLLDTIEIKVIGWHYQGEPLRELVASEVEEASKLLRENKSKAEKMVILTNSRWIYTGFELDADREWVGREVIRV